MLQLRFRKYPQGMFCGSLSPLSPLRAVIMAFLTSRIASPLEKLAGMVREDGSDVTPESLASFNAWYYEAYWLKDAVQESGEPWPG
ncbi:hypothetical protein ACFFW8_17180 [Erwinia tracheiphila]